MKSKSLLSNFLVLSLGLPVATASGQDLVWDSDTGASGNWSTADINWDSDSNGAADTAWTQNANAIFSEAAETVTVTTNNNFNNITFGITGYTIANGAGNLDIDSSDNASSITVTNLADSATIQEVIRNNGGGATAGSLEKLGSGTLTLTSNNTFTGGLTITAGTVESTAAQGFGNGGSTVSIGASGTATVTLGSDQNVNNIFTGTGILNVTGSAGAANFSNVSGLNGFTGTLNVNSSGSKKAVISTAGGNIGSGAIVNVASGATLYIANNSTYSGVTFNLAGAGNTEGLGAIRLENGTTIGATSSIVATGNTQLGHNGTSTASTINAAISETGGSRSIEKVGSGTMTFAGNNSYTGATILTAGTLSVSTDSAGAYNLGGSGTNGITFNGGALRITGTAMTNFGSHTPTFTATKTVTLDIADAANNFTVSQSLNQTTGQMIKLGTGTLTLSGANTYTGGTRINAGTTVFSGSHTKAAGTSDFLSVNNVGAQNAVLKVTSGTHGFTDINLAEATNARGAIYQSGGGLSAGSTGGGVGTRIGNGTTSYGYYNLSGGTLTNGTADFGVGMGSGATGVMDVTDGSVTTGSWLVLGRNGAGNGLLNVTGGSVTSNSNNIALNWANTAGSISVLNVGGGAGAASVTGVSNASNYFDVSQSNTIGTTGVANLLSNGTLTVGRVQSSQAGSTALFNFNGGTLKATATNSGASFMTSGNMDAVTVYSGGGTIDNSSTNITIGNALGAATGNGVTSIAVTNGGSGYIGAPMVKITGGTGNTATGYAVMSDDGTGNGTFRVSSIVITSGGTYAVDPTTVTLSGGGASTAATIGAIATAANTSGGMTFTGSGTTTLTNTNTYTGATLVADGRLLVNGTNSGGGAFNVGASGTLGGTGSVGLSTINVSGVLSPGASVETLSSGTVNFANGSTFAHELNSAVAAATGADLQIVSGDLSLTGLVNLTLADLAASPVAFTPGTIFSLINYSGSWNGGTFTFGGNALADESTFTAGLNTWQIDYNAATGGANFSGEYLGGTDSFVNLTAIPEPASILLGGLGLLALLRRRRK